MESTGLTARKEKKMGYVRSKERSLPRAKPGASAAACE